MRAVLDQRLDRIVQMYNQMDQLMDQLPIKVPKIAREQIKKIFINNKELNQLMIDINKRRPPRFILVGRTGVGKSSLINAIFGMYVAKTSAIQIGTETVEKYQFQSRGVTLFEVIDTRGLKESSPIKEKQSAEADIKKAAKDFEPDAILLVMNATERAAMDEDLKQADKIKSYMKKTTPMVTILTHVDNVEPARIKDPTAYTEVKKDRIKEKVIQVEELTKALGIELNTIIPVSSYIEWDSETPNQLPREEQERLSIAFDGRFQIEKLLDYFEHNLDFQAALHLMLSTRVDNAVREVTQKMIKNFSALASTVALTPIPVSDMSVLIPLQLVMVSFIAYLSGRDVDTKALKDFLISIGGVSSLGYSFKLIAQQGSKFLNVVLPGSGSVASSAIAYSGTYAMGKAAEAYYLDQISKKDLRKFFKKAEKEAAEQIDENGNV